MEKTWSLGRKQNYVNVCENKDFESSGMVKVTVVNRVVGKDMSIREVGKLCKYVQEGKNPKWNSIKKNSKEFKKEYERIQKGNQERHN